MIEDNVCFTFSAGVMNTHKVKLQKKPLSSKDKAHKKNFFREKKQIPGVKKTGPQKHFSTPKTCKRVKTFLIYS